MNDVTVMFKGQKVASAFAHLDHSRSLGEGITAGGFPVIGYRGKAWTLRFQGQTYPFQREDDGSPLTYLDTIIVGAGPYISKTYYPPGEWDEDSAGAPICASIKGDVPDPGVPEPQSKTCALCPNNAWTTLPNGRRGKACQDHKRLAVLLMPKVTAKMVGSPLTEPVYLKVPPGSLASLKAYGDQLSHQGFPAAAVITRVSFSPDKLFQMTFKGQQALSNKEADLVLPLLDDPRTKRITGETPEIREVKPPPVKPKAEPLIETGLMEAFGGGNGQQEVIPPASVTPIEQGKRGRGRPKGAVAATTAKVVEAADDTGLGIATTPAAEPQGDLPWGGEADTELDREVADLLSQKVSDMFK